MFKTIMDFFGSDFVRFWLEFWNFFDFFENVRRLVLPWKTGQKFFEKFAPKHVQNTYGFFGSDFVRFWLEFWKFFDFLKFFEVSSLHETVA